MGGSIKADKGQCAECEVRGGSRVRCSHLASAQTAHGIWKSKGTDLMQPADVQTQIADGIQGVQKIH